MISIFNVLLLILVIICALIAIRLTDTFAAIMALGAFSFLMCLVWSELGAPDVAFTEASVGAGVSTVLFLAALLHINRRSSD